MGNTDPDGRCSGGEHQPVRIDKTEHPDLGGWVTITECRRDGCPHKRWEWHDDDQATLGSF